MSQAEEEEKKLLDRMSMFTDAVYAIVLTLLVLELHVPELVNKNSFPEMLAGIKEISPKLFAFLLSVILVGGNWISSVNLHKVIVKTNTACVILSVQYLIIVSLFPFSCDLIGTYPDNPGSYLSFGVLSLALSANAYIWMRNNYKNKLLHPHADYAEWKKLMNMIPFLIPFLIAVSLSAFLSTKLSFLLFLLANLLPFFLTKSFKVQHKD